MRSCSSVAVVLVLLSTPLLFAAKPPRPADPDKMPMPGATMPQRWLPVDDDGWSILRPAADSRILYVSSSEGDDASGEIYKANAAEVGDDPFSPTGKVRPFRSIDAAMAQARENSPDWVLLKRGDVWRDVTIKPMQGRSKSEPSVIGAYGSDEKRPVISGRTARIVVGSPSSGISHAVVTSIELYLSHLDPDSPDYAANKDGRSRGGISLSVGAKGGMSNVLVEDCLLRFAAVNVGGPGGLMTDVVLRRSSVLDVYPEEGHNQGMWGSHASILLEECLFDHDGWLHQAIPENRGKAGLANMLSHDTYCTQMYSTIFRNNLFLRAASIGNKFTANYGPGSVEDVVLDNNLYVEGEIGIGMGGNTAAPLRWIDCQVTNNVLLDIGRGRPTGRSLGWGVDAKDWDGGEISGNLFLRQTSDEVRNVYGLEIGCEEDCLGEGPHMRNVSIRGNVFHGLKHARMALNIRGPGRMQGITIAENQFQFDDVPSTLVRVDAPLGDRVTFRGNTYFSAADSRQWFTIAGRDLSFDEWVVEVGEEGAQQKNVNFPDPSRGIEAYMESLGKPATFEAFIAEVRQQSKSNWRQEFTAPVINDWIRDGFGVTKFTAATSP